MHHITTIRRPIAAFVMALVLSTSYAQEAVEVEQTLVTKATEEIQRDYKGHLDAINAAHQESSDALKEVLLSMQLCDQSYKPEDEESYSACLISAIYDAVRYMATVEQLSWDAEQEMSAFQANLLDQAAQERASLSELNKEIQALENVTSELDGQVIELVDKVSSVDEMSREQYQLATEIADEYSRNIQSLDLLTYQQLVVDSLVYNMEVTADNVEGQRFEAERQAKNAGHQAGIAKGYAKVYQLYGRVRAAAQIGALEFAQAPTFEMPDYQSFRMGPTVKTKRDPISKDNVLDRLEALRKQRQAMKSEMAQSESLAELDQSL